MDLSTVVEFLPTVFNQLFKLLVTTLSEDVQLNVVRVLIHFIHQIDEARKTEVLQSYVKVRQRIFHF